MKNLYVKTYDFDNMDVNDGSTVSVLLTSKITVRIMMMKKIPAINILIVTDIHKLNLVEFDSVNFTLTYVIHFEQKFNSYHPYVINDGLFFFVENMILRYDVNNFAAGSGVIKDKIIESYGFCKLKSGKNFSCTNGQENIVELNIDQCSYPVDDSDNISTIICGGNCSSCRFDIIGCTTCSGLNLLWKTHCYASNCILANQYFDQVYNSSAGSGCTSTCPSAGGQNWTNCHCQTPPNSYVSWSSSEVLCVSTCPNDTGITQVNGKICLTSAECIGILARDSLNNICSDCNQASCYIQISDHSKVTCSSGQYFTSPSRIKYCAEGSNITLSFSDNTASESCTIIGNFSQTINVTKSSWSDTLSAFILNSIKLSDMSISYTFSLSGISGNSTINSFKIRFTNQSEFNSGAPANLKFLMNAIATGYHHNANIYSAIVMASDTLSNFSCPAVQSSLS